MDPEGCRFEIMRGLLLLATEELMEVLEALNRDLIAGRFHAVPNGGSTGNHLDVGGEAFDDHIPGILDRLEGRHDGLPIQRIVARNATVGAIGLAEFAIEALAFLAK